MVAIKQPVKVVILCIFFLFYLCLIKAELKNPYEVLGVGTHASNQEIRRAYKQLVKEWHPDKNNNPEAEQKFIEIKKAYELLIDSDRRRVYDQHGITNEESHHFKQKYDYSHYDRFTLDPFEEIIRKHPFFNQDVSLYHKMSITTKYFEQTIIPKSATLPYVLLFYNDWCFRCNRVMGNFKKLIDTLEPLGIQFATVNALHEPSIVRKTGISEIPSLVLVLEGHSYINRNSLHTPAKFVELIRRKLPWKIVNHIDDNNVEEFLKGWTDNKVRALVVEPRNQTRLRYLIAAYNFRYKVAFGFVQIGSNSRYIQDRFGIQPNFDTVLIFNEDSNQPVATISMPEIPLPILKNVISSHQYLTLPRLSSQEMLEGVCPAEWNRPRKRLCVILITENCEAHNFARGVLRHIARHSEYSAERVRFAYMFQEKQSDFVNAISKGSLDNKLLRLVIIWRRDASHIKYEWISDASLDIDFSSAEAADVLVNSTKSKIDVTIQRLLRNSEPLSYEAFVEGLLDEHAEGILSKWISKFLNIAEYFSENIQQEHILAILSLIGTIAFMFAIGYVMVYFVQAEEQNLKAKGQVPSNVTKKANYVPELKLHELRAETYNGMVRLLKPGCRTIVLIADMQTRTKLIPTFHKSVWPYRKSKTLIFGHMLIEKGLSWYSELLRLSLCETKNLQINPRNCVGTVIALNGHRKYFCMYHAKHPESNRGEKRIAMITKQLLKRSDDIEAGTKFTECPSDSENEPKILIEENLLDGFSLWLDRLFEGTTYRYYINYWPDFQTK